MQRLTPVPTTAMIRQLGRVKRKMRGLSRIIYCCHMLLMMQIVGVSGTGQQWFFQENRFMHNLDRRYWTSSADPSLCALLCGQDPTCVGFTVDPCVLYAELAPSCAARDPAEPPGFLKYITNGGNLGWRFEPIGLNQTCPTSFEFLAVTGSCYLYQETTKASTRTQLQQVCAGHGAHLLAVNSKEEHDWIKSYMSTNHGDRTSMWTGGKANVPDSSTSSTDWSWELCDGTKQQATYFDWIPGEPNGSDENYMMLKKTYGYQFFDVKEDVSALPSATYDKPCFICEISA